MWREWASGNRSNEATLYSFAKLFTEPSMHRAQNERENVPTSLSVEKGGSINLQIANTRHQCTATVSDDEINRDRLRSHTNTVTIDTFIIFK